MQNSSPSAGKRQQNFDFEKENGVSSLKLIFQVIGKKSAAGATYKSMELVKLLDVFWTSIPAVEQVFYDACILSMTLM
ncbi:hypothetical protein BRADI_2g34096v3 [Brachypodium distachyon]|uniref:Uncharacterized protein n=1 Tax=Brachypodium distachyon TaxID=15368 RepID=I1HLA6_BRADI|nr:hypothetical protein BRADI_2g34096v3 [Brachypodium distachyon]